MYDTDNLTKLATDRLISKQARQYSWEDFYNGEKNQDYHRDWLDNYIQKFEGYRQDPYKDNTQMSVGYGQNTSFFTPEILEGGVSKEEAKQGMRDHMVNTLSPEIAAKYKGINLSPRQWRTIVSAHWNNPKLAGDNTMSYLREGKLDEGFANLAFDNKAFKADGGFNKQLQSRRKQEYLGAVSTDHPSRDIVSKLVDGDTDAVYERIQNTLQKPEVTTVAPPTIELDKQSHEVDLDDIAIQMLLQDIEKPSDTGLEKEALIGMALTGAFGAYSLYDLIKRDLPNLKRSIKDRRWKNALADAAWVGVDALGVIPGVGLASKVLRNYKGMKAAAVAGKSKNWQAARGLKDSVLAVDAGNRVAKANNLRQMAKGGNIGITGKLNPFNWSQAGKANKLAAMKAKSGKIMQGQQGLRKRIANLTNNKGAAKWSTGYSKASKNTEGAFKYMKGTDSSGNFLRRGEGLDTKIGLGFLGMMGLNGIGKATGISPLSAPDKFMNYGRDKHTPEGKLIAEHQRLKKLKDRQRMRQNNYDLYKTSTATEGIEIAQELLAKFKLGRSIKIKLDKEKRDISNNKKIKEMINEQE